MPTRRFRAPQPLDLRQTLGPLWLGRPDRTMRLTERAAVRASHTPDGPATLLVRLGGDAVEAEAWGAGADWALEQAPRLLGSDDRLDGFEPERHPAVARAHRRRPGMRIGATGHVDDVLVRTVLGQKVTAAEAHRAWFGMVRAWGSPAPGPHDLLLPPSAADLAGHPYHDFHRFGVERKRAEVVMRACARFDRLQEAVAMPRQEALRRLTALPGLGPWTAGIVMRIAMGDADAVEVGDFHIPNAVCWNLAGEPRGDDERMLELLAPFAGHRGRVVRLVTSALQKAPAYGPRMRVGDPRRLDPPVGRPTFNQRSGQGRRGRSGR
jgi:3-methyladenine DNA glycosylase/8-oxoguanine DNA glycosylase